MKSQYLVSLSTCGAITLGTMLAGTQPVTASKAIFYCQSDEGMPTTVAKNGAGAEQAIFHWNLEQEITKTDSQQLCDSVTQKLNSHVKQGNDLSSLTFNASTVYSDDLDSPDLPVICVAEETDPCQLELFTLNPSEDGDPKQIASNALNSILDPALQATPVKSRVRGIQTTSYQVNFWDLLGFPRR